MKLKLKHWKKTGLRGKNVELLSLIDDKKKLRGLEQEQETIGYITSP